jgi:hypothetical protein
MALAGGVSVNGVLAWQFHENSLCSGPIAGSMTPLRSEKTVL